MKNTIRELRLENGFTQQALADAVQVSRQTIISIESGRYVPSTVLALKLARVLNKTVETLFALEKSD